MNSVALVFIAIGFLFGTVLFVFPVSGLWTLLIMAMVINGTVAYFLPQFGMIAWSLVMVAGALFVRVLPEIFLGFNSRDGAPPFFFYYFILLFLVSLLAWATSLQITDMFFAAKNFFPFWSIPFAFYYFIKKQQKALAFMQAFIAIALIAAALAVVQKYFIVVPRMYLGDSITGTFGGNMDGGGPNAVFSMFLATQILTLASLAMRRELKWPVAIMLSFFLFAPIFFTNAKVMIFCFPLGVIALLGRKIITSPLTTIMALTLCALLSGGILLFYKSEARSYGADRNESLSEYFDKSIKYNIATTGERKELTRLSAVTFWFDEHSITKGPWHYLFGHGLGSTKDTGISLGYLAAQSKYRGLRLGMTALTSLLWDLGVVGTGTFILLLLRSYFLAARLKSQRRLPARHQAFMEGAQVGILFVLLTLPYQLAVFNIPAFGAYTMFIIGYIGFWQRAISQPDPEFSPEMETRGV